YIDLEDPRDRIKLSDPMLFFHSNIDKLVIIDEVQLMPEIFSLLRSLIDQKRRSAMYMILGSASPVIMRESSQSLAGRIGYFELSGFNITELSSGVLDKHWLRGGFPDAYLAPDDKYWKLWLDNFIKTYIERDIPMLGLNIGPITLRNLWTMIAHNHGQVANYSNLSRSLELSSTTIKKYLDFLEYAFIIRQLPPYHINLKKRLVKSPKLYIRDSGVLHNLLNIDSFSDLESHLIKGSSWEGYAVEQILQLSKMSYQPYFYRTHQGSECDLILVRSSKPVYAVEIKYTSVPKLTKGNLLSFEDIDADRNFIITPDSDDFLISDNVRVCNLETFLEKYLKIS
ncbi:MAG: ATP-binding protein, partial [Bacteroidetes bacterium]|nr:ATP-binding protein [Bacteroidota bacterium]